MCSIQRRAPNLNPVSSPCPCPCLALSPAAPRVTGWYPTSSPGWPGGWTGRGCPGQGSAAAGHGPGSMPPSLPCRCSCNTRVWMRCVRGSVLPSAQVVARSPRGPANRIGSHPVCVPFLESLCGARAICAARPLLGGEALQYILTTFLPESNSTHMLGMRPLDHQGSGRDGTRSHHRPFS